MADPYLAISEIAVDPFMTDRVTACAFQQAAAGLDLPPNPAEWVSVNRWTWAASPTWGEKWASAKANNVEHPGADGAVITDGDILSTVQALAAG